MRAPVFGSLFYFGDFKMTEKKTLLMNDLEKKSLESPKLSLKEKTLLKLKSF